MSFACQPDDEVAFALIHLGRDDDDEHDYFGVDFGDHRERQRG